MVSRFYFDRSISKFVLVVSDICFYGSFSTCIYRFLDLFGFSEDIILMHINNCKKCKTTKQTKSYLNKIVPDGDYFRMPLSLF